MQWPATELDYWCAFFAIDDNNDKQIIEPEEISVEESKKGFKEIWS